MQEPLRQPPPPTTSPGLGRRIVLAAAALALFAVVGACGPTRPSPTPTQAEPAATASAQATSTPRPRRTSTPTNSPSPTPTRSITLLEAALRGQVVHFWYPYTGKAQVLLDLMTRQFNNTNRWGIHVENTALPGFNLLEDRLRQSIQQQETGQLPDVWPAITSQALLLDANGEVIADLQPYIADSEYGLSAAEQSDFLPALWQQDLLPALAVKGAPSPQGKRLGLPWVRTGVLLLYNHSWAQELGYPKPPQSATDFRDQACAAAQANRTDSDRANDATGGWLVTGDPAELAGWIFAFGGEFTRPDGRGYQFDTPAARQAVNFIHTLAQQGCAWSADASPAQAIASRQALFAAVSLSDLEQIQPILIDASIEWMLLPFLSAQVSGPAIVSYGPSLVVSQSNPERQLAAWLFVRWLASPENQARWAQLNYAFPTRSSALENLQLNPAQVAAWQTWRLSLEYLPALRAESYYASWGMVRWSLADGLAQLMLPDLSNDQVPQVLQLLDELAAEIHIQMR